MIVAVSNEGARSAVCIIVSFYPNQQFLKQKPIKLRRPQLSNKMDDVSKVVGSKECQQDVTCHVLGP